MILSFSTNSAPARDAILMLYQTDRMEKGRTGWRIWRLYDASYAARQTEYRDFRAKETTEKVTIFT